MKIVAAEAVPLTYKYHEPISDAKYFIPARTCVLVKVTTDEGLTGWGEAACFGGPPATIVTVIEQELQPLIKGADPFLRERIWEEVFQKTYQHGRKGVVIQALSGIDCALWDIIGQALNKSVYELLGGAQTKVPAYATGGFYSEKKDLQKLVEELSGAVEKGFRAVKMKIGKYELAKDIERVEAVRKAIGPDIKLMIDANGVYAPKTAVKFARAVEKCNIFFFEEPVAPHDLEGSRLVKNMVTCAVAGYESEFTRYGFKKYLDAEAVDILQPDTTWSGGITEVKKIVDLAHAFNKPFALHSYSSIYALIANAHVTAACPNGIFVEVDINQNPLREELTAYKPTIDNQGNFILPDGPGLGIKPIPEVLQRYRIS